MLDKDPKERLNWIYKAQSVEDLESRYNLWAREYEKDVAGYGYKLPGILAGFVGRYLNSSNGTILDAGAGTGITGEIMSLLGYKSIIAIDISTGMLELAKEKGVYQNISRMVLGERLDFPDDYFAGVVLMGVLSIGHAPPESFDELIRCTIPDGYIIFSVRTDAPEFQEAQDKLEQAGKWRSVEETIPFMVVPLEEPDIMNKVCVYRVK